MAKSKTPSYILTLKLKTNLHEQYIINKRLEIARNIFNSLMGKVLKKYNLMLESKKYRNIRKELNPINKKYYNSIDKKSKKEFNIQRKILYKQLNDIYLNFGLTQYSLYEDIKLMYKHFKKNIGSLECQAIADRVWESFDKLLNRDSKRVYFKRYGELNSLEGKWNKSGIRYLDGFIVWNKLKLPIIIKSNDLYAQKAIQDRVKYCRILRKMIKGKYHFYVQLVLEGIPPKKITKQGEIKGTIGQGNVGIDIGTQTIAISSKYDVKLLELAPNINNIDKKIKRIQRYMDRSKRSMNPNKFNVDGTIKRGNKDKWIYSKKYLKVRLMRKELYRKQSEIRKQDHYEMINWLLNLGDKFLVETMNYKGLQKRAKKTEKNDKGKFKKKKRFGKSLANKAPAMFLTILDNKLKWNGTKLYKIDTKKCKCSQYNHFTNTYNKKELKDRWNKDIKIQRDMYSAFLIMNVNNDLKSINRNKCIETYDNFKKMHDKEIIRLKELKLNGYKLISSMGI